MKSALWRVAVQTALLTAFAAVILWFPESLPFAPSPLSAEQSTALHLVHLHGCWTSGSHAIPGHVVVSHLGHVRYGGARLTGLALDQLFKGHAHGLKVWGFCR
jgi:hypothetical protein